MTKKDWRLLQAYKATGLTPEQTARYKRLLTPEVEELARQLFAATQCGNIERLYELLKADEEGRAVILSEQITKEQLDTLGSAFFYLECNPFQPREYCEYVGEKLWPIYFALEKAMQKEGSEDGSG